MPFNSWEIVELHVGGRIFRDWDTVMVVREYMRLPHYAIFTTTEKSPAANLITSMQVKPWDECTITLAGKLAYTGFVDARQGAFDAQRHGVQIHCLSWTVLATRTQIDVDKIGGGQFKKQSMNQIMKKVVSPLGLNWTTTSSASSAAAEPFDDVQVQQGESPYQLGERLGRMRNIWIGEDLEGNMQGQTNPEGASGVALVEGINIEEAVVTLSIGGLANPLIQLGQNIGSDEKAYAESSEIKIEQNMPTPRYMPGVNISEMPGPRKDHQYRAKMEFNARWAEQIEAVVVVYGWLTNGKSGDLWREGSRVRLKTAMGMVDETLWVQRVVFRQDNSGGTTTQLTLKRWLGGGDIFLGGSTAGWPGKVEAQPDLPPSVAPDPAEPPTQE